MRKIPLSNGLRFLRIAALAACFLLPLNSQTAAAQTFSPTRCATQVLGDEKFDWCFYAGASGSQRVLLFLHGAGGSVQSWSQNSRYQSFYADWAKQGGQAPHVIAISQGKTWFLKNAPTPLQEGFLQTLLRQIENANQLNVTSHVLLGESMGGFNSSVLLLHAPKFFTRVALACPALTTLSPRSNENELNDFLQRHRPYVREDWIRWWLGELSKAYVDAAMWLAHNPLSNVGQTDLMGLKIFVTASHTDGYAFMDGTISFEQQARTHGADVQFIHHASANHCEETKESLRALARFLGAP